MIKITYRNKENALATLGRIRPLADLVKPGNVGIVSYGSVGHTRRRTLGPVPEFQVAQDIHFVPTKRLVGMAGLSVGNRGLQ